MNDPGLRRLPPSFAERARAAQVEGFRPVGTRDAATVVLLRSGPAGPEAYLLRRVAGMAFAAGSYVFPGGSVDPRDGGVPADRWVGPAPAQWARLLAAGERLAAALVCAAVRETFEESAVLLAGPGEGEVVDPGGPAWEAERQALLAGTTSLAELLARRGLRLRADLLRPWARWVTPEAEPRRYDTRFFVAALPAGQQPREVGGEADAARWLTPRAALELASAGEVGLLPPTAYTLAELAAYADVAGVLAAAAARDLRPVLPRVVLSGADAVALLPGDDGYPD